MSLYSGTLVCAHLYSFDTCGIETLSLVETAPALSSAATTISTYEIVKNIQSAVAPYGPLKSIRLYWDFGGHHFPSTTRRIRSELSASGVNLVDCPAEGRKGAAIKKMLGM